MNKTQALYSFWSGFGLPAIDEQSDYDTKVLEELEIDYPLITYECAVGDFGEPVALSADVYYRDTSWAAIDAKAEEIWNAIGYGGVLIDYDGGRIWLKRGTYERIAAEGDYGLRRYHFNMNAEYHSA